MHMADALVSPAVGGTLWAAAAGVTGYCSRKLKNDLDNRTIPLMGVVGAFIFAAQMINFTIPGTGSSGHLGGGMILAVLLGPHAAFLVMASVLTVQALFFADGGLLALGCNTFNLAFFPAFVAYPLIYKKIVGNTPTRRRIMAGAITASVIGLQLGALGVVVQTVLSGVSDVSPETFVLLMQPIHLVIGVVEGIVTAAIITFVYRHRPDILDASSGTVQGTVPMKGSLAGLLAVALLTAGVVSWVASTNPDGLEWALTKSLDMEQAVDKQSVVHERLSSYQEQTAVLPDYGFKDDGGDAGLRKLGKTVSGILGSVVTLFLAVIVGIILKRRNAA